MRTEERLREESFQDCESKRWIVPLVKQRGIRAHLHVVNILDHNAAAITVKRRQTRAEIDHEHHVILTGDG